MKTQIYTDKIHVFRSLLKLAIFLGIALSGLNLISGSKALALFQLAVIGASAFMLWQFNRVNSESIFKLLSHVLLLCILSIMMYAFWAKGHLKITFIWALTIPILSYQLTTLKRGVRITAVFICLTALLYLKHHIIGEYIKDIYSMTMGVLCMLSVWILTHSYEASHVAKNTSLLNMASHDALTSLRNRTTLQGVFDHCKPYPIGLIMLDIDNFKNINDTYGHDAGDQVLLHMAKCLNDHVSKRDFVFRLGGEEFCIIMPKARIEDITGLSSKLIKQISYLQTKSEHHQIQFTASAGAAYFPEDADNLSSLLKVADERLYRSKQEGKNRVTFYPQLV